MAMKERHPASREAVRRAILSAARALFVRHGYENVSMRKIAERIDYSAAAIYLYFPSKADIFYALAEDGFRLFSRAVTVPDGNDTDPLQAVEDRFWRYYEFSKRQPEYFWLMFVDRAVPRISRDWERFSFMRQTREDAFALIRRAVDHGAFPPGTSIAGAFHVLVTAVHGAAVMRLAGRFCSRKAADALARDTLHAALAGLRAGVAMTFSPSSEPASETASEAGAWRGTGMPGSAERPSRPDGVTEAVRQPVGSEPDGGV